MKLLKQVQRQEGEEVVLGCVDGVALKREPLVVGMQCYPGTEALAGPAHGTWLPTCPTLQTSTRPWQH